MNQLEKNPKIIQLLKTKKSRIPEIKYYFVIVLLILLEDSPFFLNVDINRKLWVVISGLLILFTFGKKNILNQKIIKLIIVVWGAILIQMLIFGGGLTPAAFYKPIWYFYTPFLVFAMMGTKYFKYLFNTIYFVAIYTSVIYILQTFIPPFHELLMQAFKSALPYSWADWPRTILIYSVPRASGYLFLRNSGIFHEPGAYSIYLMLAIILNTYFTKQPMDKKNLFLSAVLLSTFSTTGYIILFVFYSFYILKAKIHFLLKPIFIITFIIVILKVYEDTSFLKQKIDYKYTKQLEAVEYNEINQRGRFYAFGMSVKSFISAPITGRGIIGASRYDVGERGSFGYGFAGLFARYGLFFGLFYMWFFYKGFMLLGKLYKIQRLYVIAAFLTINLGLLTQGFFFHTPFIFFFILGYMYSEKNREHLSRLTNKRNERVINSQKNHLQPKQRVS